MSSVVPVKDEQAAFSVDSESCRSLAAPDLAQLPLVEQARHLVELTELRHVAIIMDGNRRWAKARNLPALAGHQQGVSSLKRLVRFASRAGIQTLTAFAFSTENWQRSEQEVGFLMNLFVTALTQELADLDQEGVRLTFIGDLSQMPKAVQQTFQKSARKTAHNDRINLRLAVNYGARQEIIQAVQALARQVAAGTLDPQAITEGHLSAQLYDISQCGAPDLLIRPGGEHRLSNFLLWQCAYTELVWSTVYWPDYDERCLLEAITTYAHRQRRFGR